MSFTPRNLGLDLPSSSASNVSARPTASELRMNSTRLFARAEGGRGHPSNHPLFKLVQADNVLFAREAAFLADQLQTWAGSIALSELPDALRWLYQPYVKSDGSPSASQLSPFERICIALARALKQPQHEIESQLEPLLPRARSARRAPLPHPHVHPPPTARA